MKDFLKKLLNGQKVEWKKLGEVCEVRTGGAISKDFISKNIGEYPVINSGIRPLGFVNTYNTDNDPIGITSRGAGVGSITYREGRYFRGNLNYSCTIKNYNSLLVRYVFYVLNYMQAEIKALCTYQGIPALNASNIKQLELPIPPLSVQREIVRILDSFTELTTELKKELTARKKQYSYYRDKLLTFKDGEVEWKKLGEVGEFVRGGNLQKKDFTETGVGCIHYGQIYTHYGLFANKTKTFVSAEFAKKARKAQFGNLVIATTSENDEDVCKAVAWLGNEDIAVSSDACIYKHNLNPKYVSYFFQTEQFQTQKRQYITGAKVRRVNAYNLEKFPIPIPPLSRQKEIVEILDKFDSLTNSISEGLPKEIELRQKQYEYYRNQLLNFEL